MDSLCHVRNKLMYVLSWQTVSALTPVLFLCLLPLFLHNSGNKPQDNLLMSAGTVCCIYSREILVIPSPTQPLTNLNWYISSLTDGLLNITSTFLWHNTKQASPETWQKLFWPFLQRFPCDVSILLVFGYTSKVKYLKASHIQEANVVWHLAHQ